MMRVTKQRGYIAFATWRSELADGRMFDAMAKHIHNSSPSSNPIRLHLFSNEVEKPQCCEKTPGGRVTGIYFERGAIKKTGVESKPLLANSQYQRRHINTGNPNTQGPTKD
jgi:hypothetical protein